MQEKKQKINMF